MQDNSPRALAPVRKLNPQPGTSMDQVETRTQLGTYFLHVKTLADPTAKDDVKLKAAQELSENFENITSSQQYPLFLDHAITVFLKILQDGEPHFIAEYSLHQIRKLLLEMIYRIPTNKYLKPYEEPILKLAFKLLETENEQNVLVCLRIIIELHKHFRPAYNVRIQHFLQFVRSIYQDLSEHVNKIFEPKKPIKVKDLPEVDVDSLLKEIYTLTSIQCEKKKENPDGTPSKEPLVYNLIPKGVLSLKVLQELPIVVVLMYELYKTNVHQDVTDYIPIIIKTLTLQPLEQHRLNPSFNKEVFVDFMGAQIKTLSFLAYITRFYQDAIRLHSALMVKGMLGMLSLCPKEVTNLRKELLIAARHIFATDLKQLFVQHMERLFDEEVLLGKGWTTHETLRPLAYSMLADLVHNVRLQLPMSDLVKAVNLFSKNVHDETLPTSVQTISCKVLLNLVECIRLLCEKEPAQAQIAQDLLMHMLEVCVVKFKTVAKLHLPILIAKTKQAAEMKPTQPAASTLIVQVKKEEPDTSQPVLPNLDIPVKKPEEKEPVKCKFSSSTLQSTTYTVSDCKNLVKTLVFTVKTITWKVKSLNLQLHKPEQTEVYIRLVKWALQALDIYTLSATPAGSLGVGPAGQRPILQQTVRTKEEKDVLEHFAGVFAVMNPQTFREIFSTTIEYMVERIANNFALQIVGNSFLSNNGTSPLFATVLVEYLLGRMEEMGNGNMERSNLYLKLFKLVFGSVSIHAAENELMLKPHLHQIVNRSMELAMTAKEPYNYFLLLRNLFRSIGGGNHDLLYQEFLPLLPNLLQGLNSLQSGLHKQHMKDLFVELCLTVPVRLSSLLPYLPMLMDPLVSALNGSPTLIPQGLRTLELCVDNLQPEFLYEHIQPVRADLMQALWRSLRNPTDQVAAVAFRVLGKFGGGNRKMMIEPQKLEYTEQGPPGPSLVISFPEHDNPIELPIVKIIETATNILKPGNTDVFYRTNAWEVVRSYLLSSISFDDDPKILYSLLIHQSFKMPPADILRNTIQPYKCQNKRSRQTQIEAIKGMFLASIIKDLSSEVEPTFEVIVRHYTLVAISQQTGPFSVYDKSNFHQNSVSMDPLVLIDALALIMGHEEKELCNPGRKALDLILETAQIIVGSKDLACKLPLMEYIADRMCSLCYDRAWYTKLGGCMAIMFLYESMSKQWVYRHLFVFVKAQLFVMMDLTGEVSSGALDQAKSNLEALIKMCAPLVDARVDLELAEIQKKALTDVTFELIKQVTSPTTLIREQSMHLLRVFAGAQNKTVVQVMEPHKDCFIKMIPPPKKHLLHHQAANAQIGIMEGNTFCTTLTPRLFTIDLKQKEHEVFFQEIMSLCETQDSQLLKIPCYKNIGSLVPLRKAAMRALAACHYLPSFSDRIFKTFYQSLEKDDPELQEAAFECMKTFLSGTQVDMSIVNKDIIQPLLALLNDYRNINLSVARRLSYLVQLFPESFEKLCETLIQSLQALLETVKQSQTGITKSGETEVVATIINIFHQIPGAGARYIEPLCQLVLQTERSLLVSASSPFRHPLLKFLLRYPHQTVNLLLSDLNIKDDMWNKYLEYLIKQEEGKPFREILQSDLGVKRLIAMALCVSSQPMTILSQNDLLELQFQSIRIVSLLIKHDNQWIANQHQLAQTFIQIWCSEKYLERHRTIENVDYSHCKEPKLLVKILLNYFTHHPTNVDLLFQLLTCFCDRYLCDFQFLKEFLETTVAQSYTIEWKRSAFFRFVDLFPKSTLSNESKAKILQLLIIPCFENCFEKGECEKLIGGRPAPNEDSPDNIVSVFIYKIIDPDHPFDHGDSVRIRLLQMSCLLVQHALPHIHDTATKTQGSKLRRLMLFAWPCLVNNNCVDPATKYHGHLLFTHIIPKLGIQTKTYTRIVLQVFRTLLKAHALEVRNVVRQALDILTPALPDRIEDGYRMLTHWTKKIIVEEGHSMQQLFHIVQLVVRQYNVYYPVRHSLLQHLVSALQRLGFTPSSTLEHKKLGYELAEVILKWEYQRIKDEAIKAQGLSIDCGVKRAPGEEGGVSISIKHDPDEMKPLEKAHADTLINFLMRLACTVNEENPTPGVAGIASPGEVLSRRCYNLIRTALKPDLWPKYNIDFRLVWLDKIFCSIEHPKPNLGNICIGLELFTLALSVMTKEQVLLICKILQKGINTCISSTNNRVIRLTHALLTKLMGIFPAESSNSQVASKYEELECIYASVGRVAFEGLTKYEQNTGANASSLFGTIMVLKAACSSNPSYIDGLIINFVRVILRMSREHLSPNNDASAGTSDLLILSLDLVKNRVVAMSSETKKTFIGTVLVSLIEKTTDIKVMKAICKMIEEWMKNAKPYPTTPSQLNTGPSLREKSILLIKLMHYVEKNFPDLNTQFLELVNYVYRDEAYKNTELIPKLEPAFLAGLRCSQPQMRAKFFEIFDGSMRRKLHDRLMYIVSSQNWEVMGQQYWIKQCIELILVTADENTFIELSSATPVLPKITSVVSLADSNKLKNFQILSMVKKENAMETDDEVNSVQSLIERHIHLKKANEIKKTVDFLSGVIQLCHFDSALAERIWLDLYPCLWNILTDRQRMSLSRELLPFLVSGCHTVQKDMHPSALSTIFESLFHCNPPLPIKPAAMAYLGKSHNLWHRVTLSLEKMVSDTMSGVQSKVKHEDCYEFEAEPLPQHSAVEYLAEMYSQLREEDMWCALWQKHARYKETCTALAYEQQGQFDQALANYEAAILKGRHDYSTSPAPISLLAEQKLWEKQWIRCSKELNQWFNLLEYARTKGSINTFLILESAWRIPDWSLMKDVMAYVETGCPKELGWKVHLYRGFLTICHPQEQHLPIVERYVELASTSCMKEWRKLPHIVSHIHLPLLQAAQQIMELQEACQIHQGMMQDGRPQNSLHDMKAIVKTWRNRIPIIADDLSHWSDIFTWRQHHYTFISSKYATHDDQEASRSTFGVHDSCQAIIHFGKIARKQNLTGVCQESLSRIYTIPKVPLADCFHNIRQQLKCFLQMAATSNRSKEYLLDGLKVVESTNLKYFSKEMTSECYALKGMLLSQLGRIEDANKSFSSAAQLNDTLVKAWALWGEFIETQFTKSSNPDISDGVSAISCFLHACRHQNESKSRKYLAKVLWLLTYDDKKFSLTEAVDRYAPGVPPIQWLPWIPQLLTCLMRNEGHFMISLLNQVGRMFPQAVYFPARTLFISLKIEQRERYKSIEKDTKPPHLKHQNIESPHPEQGVDPKKTIEATPSMCRLSKLIQMQKTISPTVMFTLEGIVDQMVWFRENWYEEVSRQLRQGLAKCYAIAFENRGAIGKAKITQHTLQFVKKIVTTFGGIGIENAPNAENPSVSSPASESLVKRAELTRQDPVFQEMKRHFGADFNFSDPSAMELQNVIHKLKKWVKILEGKIKILPKSFLIEEKCRFLSNFSLQTAETELPGEFLLPKHSHYYVRISRFMPRVEIVQKHNTAARRLFIRGHNGKIYPYLVVNDSGLGDARREERVLQLFRMLNHYLGKQKETSRRFLHITVPRVVAVYPQIRLVEDNPSSVSLFDIYKTTCANHGVEYDAPVKKYYEKLQSIQARGMQTSHQNLKEILKDVQTTMIPKTLLKDWALKTYLSPTDFWTFRKMITLQLALACFCEYVLHLTRLNPDMLYIHQDSGLLNVAYFKFDIEDSKGELDANRPVPFRLTPNIQELLSETGISGPLTASMIATARCFAHPNFKVASILKAILRDEMIYFHRKKQEEESSEDVRRRQKQDLTSPPADVAGELIIHMVTHAVNSITQRLNSLANFDDTESKVGTLVVAAKSPDNLCRMDPAWHPWL